MRHSTRFVYFCLSAIPYFIYFGSPPCSHFKTVNLWAVKSGPLRGAKQWALMRINWAKSFWTSFRQLEGWPDVATKGSPIISESCQNVATQSALQTLDISQNNFRKVTIFELLLKENWSPIPFMNLPIWSHCQPGRNGVLFCTLYTYEERFALKLCWHFVVTQIIRVQTIFAVEWTSFLRLDTF